MDRLEQRTTPAQLGRGGQQRPVSDSALGSRAALASKLLALAARTLPAHWQARYGYRALLLETFVEAERFNATCYQAANWVYVGDTQGRGKLGDHRLGQVPVKTVWLYPLVADCRARLCR